MQKLVVLILGILFWQNFLVAQNAGKCIINQIDIVGNKRTKNYIVLREAQLQQNDTLNLNNLNFILKEARRNIYNTTLFDSVTVTATFTSTDSSHASLHIYLRERWPIYPIPIFALVDRNYSEWIRNYNADLNRIVYGIKFTHNNTSGRRDQLRLQLFSGYQRGATLTYSNPYANKKLTSGFSLVASYTESKEVQYGTSFTNKLVTFTTPYKADITDRIFVNKFFLLGAGYSLRKGIYNTQNFSITYQNKSVNDSIGKFLNPNFFGKSQSKVQFLDVSYNYNHLNVDNARYPLKGVVYGGAVLKRGFGFNKAMDMLSVDGLYHKFFELKNNWYFNSRLQGSIRLPLNSLSTFNARALGYGAAYLRGLDLLVVDGAAYAVTKNTLLYKFAKFKLRVPFKVPFFLKKNDAIPFTFYGKIFSDYGYVYNKNTPSQLNNKLLHTYGIGTDVLTFYDMTFSFTYAFNQLKQNGFFFNIINAF
jgi:outer membrane protein assembly factor BamA